MSQDVIALATGALSLVPLAVCCAAWAVDRRRRRETIAQRLDREHGERGGATHHPYIRRV